MTTKTSTLAWPNYGASAQLAGQAAVDGNYTGPRLTSHLVRDNVFNGVENRNWKRQVRAGANATTPASGSKYQRFGLGPQYYCFGYVNSVIPTPANARRSSLWPFNLPLNSAQVGSPQETTNINAARTKFSKSVEKAMTQFSGGVFLAELRETLHMIRRPGQSLFKEIGQYLGAVQKNARRLKRQPKYKREQWLSNTWLEYSFGWAPLLNDLDDARNYLQKRQDALYQELVPVKGGSTVDVLRTETAQGFASGPASLSCRERVVDTYMCFYAGAVSSRALSQNLISASALGLSPRSFVPTLWEVIPWSFVIDYFTNVGDVLTGWSNQSCTLAWGRETLIRQRKADYIDQRGTNTLLKVIDSHLIPSSQFAIGRSFVRSPLTEPPLPSFQFEIPGIGVKWINLGALANTRRSIGAFRLWV